MRAIMIETINESNNLIECHCTQNYQMYLNLISLGMSTKQLLRRGVVEFLTATGTQYRVTMMPANTFVYTRPSTLVNN